MVALLPADVEELKARLIKRIGSPKAEKYFYNLDRLLKEKITKLEFDKLCYSIVGKENLPLHNIFVRGLLGNAVLAARKQSQQTVRATVTGQSRISQPPGGRASDGALLSSRGLRLVDSSKSPIPLGTHEKSAPGNGKELIGSCNLERSREQLAQPDPRPIGVKSPFEVVSVEDGEEAVSSSPCVQSSSPIAAPLGIIKTGTTNLEHAADPLKLRSSLSCYLEGELHDTNDLYRDMVRRLEAEGVSVSVECANIVNNALDLFLKRLIKPSTDMAKARWAKTQANSSVTNVLVGMSADRGNLTAGSDHSSCASLQDYLVSMESNPQLFGVQWPVCQEKMRRCIINKKMMV